MYAGWFTISHTIVRLIKNYSIMKLERQQNKTCIRDFNRLVCGGQLMKNKVKHDNVLPDNIRCIICGPSNCGKTNRIFNLLFDPNGLRFKNVYIFSKSLYQQNICFYTNFFRKFH